MYIQRNDKRKIVACFQNPQDFETEWVDDSSEELAEFLVPPVPQVVSRFQAQAALYLEGLLEQVETVMINPSTPFLARLAWKEAQEFHRNSQTVLAMASVLNLSDKQLDDLFRKAAEISA